ncbi:MAG: hypothetical protein R3202_10290, partial [Candidatus Competibacterales bacterium]|nr:hypothetical protein [Candidatus Competibacterales bacterium]
MLAVLILIGTGYGLAELIYSTLYASGLLAATEPFWIYEDSGNTLYLDPGIGFGFGQAPARMAKIGRGPVEYQGVLQGNELGFLDRDPFLPCPSSAEKMRRFAVLGDSFTAAQYLSPDWTGAVEQRAARAGQSIELLNFAQSGTGLGNWWRIITRILRDRDFCLDGIVFAVFEGNLHRSFAVARFGRDDRLHFGRSASWNPEDWPETTAQAIPLLQPMRGFLLPPDDFDRALTGNWQPPDPPRPFRPYATLLLTGLMQDLISTPEAPTVPMLNPAQKQLIERIRSVLHTLDLPVLVAAIPSRERLLAGMRAPEDVQEFARLLQARFIDGFDAFAGMTSEAIRAHWLPHDGHWAQAGS